MNNYIRLILCVSIVVVSCSKTKRIEKRLPGEWHIVQYKITTADGLSFYYDAEGMLNINEFSSDSSKISFNINYTKDGIEKQRYFTGFWIQKKDGEYYDINRDNPSLLKKKIENGRILLLTTTDLKTIYTDSDTSYTLIFKK